MIEREQHNDDDRRLAAWLARAPQVPASPAFTAGVMRAIAQRQPSWHVRLRSFLFASHQLRWNVAGMAVTASLALAIGLGLLWGPLRDEASGAQMVVAHFEVLEPQARQVVLAGDFSQWQARIPLRRLPDGRWVAEVRLPPGTYEYAFVVDGGRWVQDPRATAFRDDGFGNRNALRTVMF